jgi:hypothetical protein
MNVPTRLLVLFTLGLALLWQPKRCNLSVGALLARLLMLYVDNLGWCCCTILVRISIILQLQ